MPQSPAYYINTSDEERAIIERAAWNFYEQFGRMMKVPPRLYEDLRLGGVDMTHMEADATLEAWGDTEGFDPQAIHRGRAN